MVRRRKRQRGQGYRGIKKQRGGKRIKQKGGGGRWWWPKIGNHQKGGFVGINGRNSLMSKLHKKLNPGKYQKGGFLSAAMNPNTWKNLRRKERDLFS